MAKQDWIKLSENEESAGMGWSVEWYKKNDKYSYVKAWHTSVPLSEMKRRGHVGAYIVGARKGMNGETIKKYFKTKQQALNFANAYMRTH